MKYLFRPKTEEELLEIDIEGWEMIQEEPWQMWEKEVREAAEGNPGALENLLCVTLLKPSMQLQGEEYIQAMKDRRELAIMIENFVKSKVYNLPVPQQV